MVAPSLLFLEILSVAGRSWGWPGGELLALAETLGQIEVEVAEPRLGLVAGWVGRGLTAYDAAYLALAEERGIQVITDDRAILESAGELARPLLSL